MLYCWNEVLCLVGNIFFLQTCQFWLSPRNSIFRENGLTKNFGLSKFSLAMFKRVLLFFLEKRDFLLVDLKWMRCPFHFRLIVDTGASTPNAARAYSNLGRWCVLAFTTFIFFYYVFVLVLMCVHFYEELLSWRMPSFVNYLFYCGSMELQAFWDVLNFPQTKEKLVRFPDVIRYRLSSRHCLAVRH